MAAGGLSNRFLQAFLSVQCGNFVGVFPVDKVPPRLWKKKKPCCGIINLSEAHLPGSHFIAFFIDKQKVLWYFDSYALPPPLYNVHLISFLKKWIKNNKIKYALSEPIQDFQSLFCGWHVAAFCLFVNAYPKLEPRCFVTFFDRINLRKNEKISMYLIQSLIRKIQYQRNYEQELFFSSFFFYKETNSLCTCFFLFFFLIYFFCGSGS